MTKPILIIVVAAAVVSAALAHEGHEHATGVVRERMELMTGMGQRMLASSKSLRANKDLESVTNDARAIRELASKITTLFPPGSTQFPTAAKPAVWQDWDDFTAKAKSLEAKSEKLMNTSAKCRGLCMRRLSRKIPRSQGEKLMKQF
jgi:cytochrome c556